MTANLLNPLIFSDFRQDNMVYIGVASTDHGPVVCERATIAIGKSTFWFRFLSQDGVQFKFNLACDMGRKVGFPREILPHVQRGS